MKSMCGVNAGRMLMIAAAMAAGGWMMMMASCQTGREPWIQMGGMEPAMTTGPRQRISINDDWRFHKGDPEPMTGNLSLVQWRGRGGRGAARGGASQPAQGEAAAPTAFNAAGLNEQLWQYILPTGNDFVKDAAKRVTRPAGNPADGVSFAQPNFNDGGWRQLDLPHDFAVEGPFIPAGQPGSEGGTGRLPYYGQAWYRKHLSIPAADAGKQIYLDVDGAMAYAIVFLNGQLVGGWPYGYSSFRIDLTPYVKPGSDNVLAIRLDNPPNSSRWYPGGGIYRSVWLTKTSKVHVGQWGTYITTPEVSSAAAKINLKVWVENNTQQDASVDVVTEIHALDAHGQKAGGAVASHTVTGLHVPNGKTETDAAFNLPNPKLWSPNAPNRYVAVTKVMGGGGVLDQYETPFGIRKVEYSPEKGLLVNGEVVKMNGVCDHHDLGALGSAVNHRALQRQLEILREMGCNAIRTSHNPPAPELLDMADSMGFLVMDETFDTWRSTKTPNDYGRIFAMWHEQDTRMLIRRDRNHPSVVMWSIGNEVAEQGQGDAGAAVARELAAIVHEEDPTRATTSAENNARAGSPFAAAIDVKGLNYQGSRLPNPQYGNFKQSFPDSMIYGSETASTISSRGEYTFPVAAGYGVISGGGGPPGPPQGQDTANHQMSSYDLYFPRWATSPDMEFAAQDRWPFVAGEFVWTGFDYIGEPTPWGGGNDPSRSSYFGIIDLAGFKKDRFYIYQAKWRPDFPMAHILPHWNWPDRLGEVTPVHVYTSGDEAELFLNGKSLGRKKKPELEYRIRWDDVSYQPGELRVVAYKNGKEWARDSVRTTGDAAKLMLQPDRNQIAADGHDLSFVTLTVADKDGLMAPRSKSLIHFSISGPGEIVATDNGDATDLTVFASHDRKAFNGLALAIIKAKRGQHGTVTVTAKSDGLADAHTMITTR